MVSVRQDKYSEIVCNSIQNIFLSHFSLRYKNHTLLEYPELNMPLYKPYKPMGALNTMTMRTSNPALGISFDFYFSNISVHGFHNMEIQQIEYVHHHYFSHDTQSTNPFHLHLISFSREFGRNHENTDIKMMISLPTLIFCSDATANFDLLALPTISADFVMKSTASEHL